MAQLLLIPDPRPLVERLGADFFRTVPKRPGVYLMRDANEKVLYVGKAKSLRSRLQNYRIANPDKMPRRHLKMLRQVARIEFRFAHNETAALKNESEMIRSLKPKFNRAGVWPGKTKFIVWQIVGDRLELGIAALPQPGWQRFGPVKSSCRCLHQTLARVLWLALNPERAYGELPAGWAQGNISEMVVIHCEQSAAEIGSRLDLFFWRSADDFILWLGSRFAGRIHAFERTVIESELRSLTEFAAKQKRTAQLALI
jgi:predicted GIY-YIG superfamily endonuclease